MSEIFRHNFNQNLAGLGSNILFTSVFTHLITLQATRPNCVQIGSDKTGQENDSKEAENCGWSGEPVAHNGNLSRGELWRRCVIFTLPDTHGYNLIASKQNLLGTNL